MKKSIQALILLSLLQQLLHAQKSPPMIAKDDLRFLAEMTKAVIDSARIQPGEYISHLSGANQSGGVLIRPGGRDDYPAFWIRDYAMSLESGFVTKKEQRHMLLLTASTQCDQPWITKNGSMIPMGSIPDHIRIDNKLPVYFPGTYSYEEQGDKYYGMVPPYDDQFYFIHMAYYYVKSFDDSGILQMEINGRKLIDRMELGFLTPPARPNNGLVFTTPEFRGVDFGFRDGIQITGDLCFSSILKYTAAIEMGELLSRIGRTKQAAGYRVIAKQIKEAIPTVFANEQGMLRASTGWSAQPDVWATALAIYAGVLEGEQLRKACQALTDDYIKGVISYKGNIRHVATTDDFNGQTAWEKTEVDRNRYQNGAYWGTPTGWVCYAINRVAPTSAQQLAGEYIAELRENDFRKGPSFGAPYECFYPPAYRQNPLYMTTVACPYIVFKRSQENK